VQRRENRPGSQSGLLRLFKRAQQAICQKGIERYLLQEAKCEVSSKALHADQVCRQAVKHAEKQPRRAHQNARHAKKPERASCCRPQIIGPPADRLWRVAPGEETQSHPGSHGGPGPRLVRLQLPDVPGHKP